MFLTCFEEIFETHCKSSFLYILYTIYKRIRTLQKYACALYINYNIMTVEIFILTPKKKRINNSIVYFAMSLYNNYIIYCRKF